MFAFCFRLSKTYSSNPSLKYTLELHVFKRLGQKTKKNIGKIWIDLWTINLVLSCQWPNESLIIVLLWSFNAVFAWYFKYFIVVLLYCCITNRIKIFGSPRHRVLWINQGANMTFSVITLETEGIRTINPVLGGEDSYHSSS